MPRLRPPAWFVYRRASRRPFYHAFVYKRASRSDDGRVTVEHFAKLARRLDLVALHALEQAQDVAPAGQRHALPASQVLDDLDLDDVPLRVATPAPGGATRLEQVRPLEEHERPRPP